MRERCSNEHLSYYKNYGGRGIRVCEEWEDYSHFKEWALANGYQDELSIDRIDNDKGYCPQNCRWVTNKKQANNRRSNKKITYNGETKTIAEWADFLGMNYTTLHQRISAYNWDIKNALETPVKSITEVKY